MCAVALSENAVKILRKRYLTEGESVDDLWSRVSGGNEDYRRLMADLRFLPNSPTLFNAGLNNGCTLSACFVFDVADSMFGPNSIVETRAKAIAVAKAGGGVGYYFSLLRPKGAPIKSIQRVACGPVMVLRDYHGISRLVTQGGKRELAQMGVLDCDHADVEEFVHCKDEDPQGLGSFNISVGWLKTWADRVQAEPVGREYNKQKETALWWDQCKSAWSHGCPGMSFPDTVNAANGNKHLGLIHAPNPCFTGDTLVWTIYGPKRFDELVGTEVPVLSEDDKGNLVYKTMRNIVKTRSNERTYRVTVRARRGHSHKYVYGHFTATADHLVFMRHSGQRRVADLEPGDRLSSVYRNKANSKGYTALTNTEGDSDVEHRIVVAFAHGCRPPYPEFHVDHIDEDKTNNHPDNLRVLPAKEHNALKMLGDRNPVVREPEKNVFSRPGFREQYGDGGGFTGRRHSEESKAKTSASLRRHHRRKKGQNHEVMRVEYVGRADVYDGTVDDTHSFFVVTEHDGGVLVHNCGETPNRNNEPCRLGSHALPRYFRPGNRDLDWGMLEDDLRLSVRFSDELIDRDVYPHPDIEAAALLTRKLGIGAMGYADLLAMMGVHYDTEEAVAFGGKLMKFFRDVTHDESAKLAKERGPYAGYSDRTEGPCLRNETLTSIAPTGTIALLAGLDNSQSIEPHYADEGAGEQVERTTAEGMKLAVHGRDRFDGFRPKTAHQIPWQWHVRHQAAFQAYTDLGVSKTINLPNSATVEDVSAAYRMMYESGCKGGTVYRDGSRQEQVLVKKPTRSVYSLPGTGVAVGVDASGALTEVVAAKTPRTSVRLQPDRPGGTHEFHIKDGSCEGLTGFLNWTMNPDGTLCEFFLRFAKIGTTMGAMMDTWAISFSIARQGGTPLEDLCKHHVGTRFEPCGLTDNKDIPVCTSIPDYVCRWLLKKFAPKDTNGVVLPPRRYRSGQLCPDCGAEAVLEAGCLTCKTEGCGWSKCG